MTAQKQSFTVAAIQTVSSPDVADNLARVGKLVAQAAQQGAQLVLLPEYWPLMGMREADKVTHAEHLGCGPIQESMVAMARTHGIWLLGGTLPLVSGEPGKVLNSLLVIDPQGQVVTQYDKIHLFGFNKGEESYDEARTIVPGSEVVAFEAPFGRVGLSICYDLRFPELYRAMGTCSLIVVPAAFTYTTGKAHWELLLRARAVENQCYVLAAAQGGRHQNGRRTWGHSMFVDPWGEVLAEQAEGEGVVLGTIDAEVLREVRENLPALAHRRL